MSTENSVNALNFFEINTTSRSPENKPTTKDGHKKRASISNKGFFLVPFTQPKQLEADKPCKGLNRDCSGFQNFKDCPYIFKEMQNDLFEFYRHNEGKKRISTARVTAFIFPAVVRLFISSSTNRYSDKSSGKFACDVTDFRGLKVKYRIDSGGDAIAISNSIVQFLNGKFLFVLSSTSLSQSRSKLSNGESWTALRRCKPFDT